jgi:hypothetical protein
LGRPPPLLLQKSRPKTENRKKRLSGECWGIGGFGLKTREKPDPRAI